MWAGLNLEEGKAVIKNGYEWRFRQTRFRCPMCGARALEDASPPNYWGGEVVGLGANSEATSYTMSGMKHVCTHCCISFQVYFYEKTRPVAKTENDIQWYGTETVEKHLDYLNVAPLERRNGQLLTPHDVYCEAYKEEHGEYPQEVYA